MKKSNSRLILSLLLSFFLFSCGGGKDSDSDDDTGPVSSAVSYEDSESLFDDVSDKLEEAFKTQSLDDAFASIADYLTQQPEVAEVNYFPTTDDEPLLSATLKNGAVIIFPLIYLDEAIPAPKPSQKHLSDQGLLHKPEARANFDLPQTDKAIFLQLQGLPTNGVNLMNSAKSHGYDAKYSTNADIDFFKTLNDYSLVHIASHGTYIKHNNVYYTSIGTSETRSRERDLALEKNGDFENIRVILGRGVYVIGKDKPLPKNVMDFTYYFVTDRFIDTYVGEFEDYSLVYIDTCWSAAHYPDDAHDLPALAEVFLNNKNVAAYLGWDRPVFNHYANRASDYLYSRMLADKRFEPKDPHIIPWGLTESFTGLQEKGYEKVPLRDPPTRRKTTLNFIPRDFGSGDQYDVRLLPTISGHTVEIDLEEETTSLLLDGDFGDTKGKAWLCENAKVDNTDNCDTLTIDTWEEDSININFDNCKDCKGYLVVGHDKRISNAHPLTRWNGDITIEGDANPIIGPEVNATLTFSVRGEILDERATAEGEPIDLFSQTSADFDFESKLEYQFSGTFEDSAFIYTYKPGANKGSIKPSAEGFPAFAGAIFFKPDEQTAMFASTSVIEAIVEKTDKSTMETTTEKIPVAIPVVMDLEIDQYGKISSGDYSLGTIQLSWESITPENAPDENTPR